jgi:hypothetical protein
MNDPNGHLDTLKDIKKMMERSSRFISLSGLSGIAAGACGLAGAWFTNNAIKESDASVTVATASISDLLNNELVRIAFTTFIAAFALAFIFTYWRSKKTNTPIWGTQAVRLMLNVAIPMIVGGFFLIALLQNKVYGLIAPGCLIFYGLALLNASKYTLREIRYLALTELLLGIINLWVVDLGIYFWAFGFGVLHIVYGTAMWWKYER